MNTSRKIYACSLAGVAFWCALILLAPVAQQSDLFAPLSAVLYNVFSHVCHQFGDRTFLLGSEPLAVCIRCTAIYAGFLIGLVAFPFLKRLDRPTVPSRTLLILALAPMALDVVLASLGIHSSTVATRLVTGFLTGVVLPFYFLPPLFEAFLQFTLFRGDFFHARQTQ